MPLVTPNLLATQREAYPLAHRDRTNLLLHALTWPFFVSGLATLVSALASGRWLVAPAGLVAMAVAMALQGRGHRMEKVPPAPFLSPLDLVVRIFTEQLLVFPRFVLSGGFARAWREAAPPAAP